MEHETNVERGFSIRGWFTAACSCGWIGGDYGCPYEADREAKLHLEGSRQSWQLGPIEQAKGPALSEEKTRPVRVVPGYVEEG